MGFGKNWTDFLARPAFVLNLDRRPDRLARTTAALEMAGFSDIRRFAAIDGQSADLPAVFASHGITTLGQHDQEFITSKGKQGCMLSHLAVLRHVRDHDLPFVHVFEDDITFHTDFSRLGPQFLRATPPRTDMIYTGSQIGLAFGTVTWPAKITQAIGALSGIAASPRWIFGDLGAYPAYCLHAYSLTRTGIAALYDFLTRQEHGAYTVDCMTIDGQRQRVPPHVTRFPIRHTVWDARRFPDPARQRSASRTIRNAGLVYQDADLGSDIDAA